MTKPPKSSGPPFPPITDAELHDWRRLAVVAGPPIEQPIKRLIVELRRARSELARAPRTRAPAADANPLDDTTIAEIRRLATGGPLSHSGDPENTWLTIARLLDTLDMDRAALDAARAELARLSAPSSPFPATPAGEAFERLRQAVAPVGVPSHRWRDETKTALASPGASDNKWLLRFSGALDEIDRLRELATEMRAKLDAPFDNLETLALLLRGLQSVQLLPADSGDRPWNELDEKTRSRWLRYAGFVADGFQRLKGSR
jgi:hypothetical protein